MKPAMLITGGAGLLAANWAMQMRHHYEITLGLHTRQIKMPEIQTECIELHTPDAVLRVLDRLEARIVVHTAALTNIEKCQADPLMARHVNTHMASNVAIACARYGAKLIHISTDHLFDGETPMLSETAPTSPVNVYGLTKAEGEVRVLEACPDALVLRTNFFGWGLPYRKSFSDQIIETLRIGKSSLLFTDVFFTPILISRLIQAAHELCDKSASGIFNLVSDERISKHAFGIKLAEALKLDTSLIVSSHFADRVDLIKRPFDLSLSNEKVCRFLGWSLGDIDANILQMLETKPPIVLS